MGLASNGTPTFPPGRSPISFWAPLLSSGVAFGGARLARRGRAGLDQPRVVQAHGVPLLAVSGAGLAFLLQLAEQSPATFWKAGESHFGHGGSVADVWDKAIRRRAFCVLLARARSCQSRAMGPLSAACAASGALQLDFRRRPFRERPPDNRTDRCTGYGFAADQRDIVE